MEGCRQLQYVYPKLVTGGPFAGVVSLIVLSEVSADYCVVASSKEGVPSSRRLLGLREDDAGTYLGTCSESTQVR